MIILIKIALVETPEFVLELEELNNHIGKVIRIHEFNSFAFFIFIIGTKKKEEFLSYTQFRDDLMSRKAHNKPVPSSLVKYLEKSDLLAGMEMAAVFEYEANNDAKLNELNIFLS